MGIIGIGTDIVKTSRVEKLIGDSGKRFLERIFTPSEIEYAESQARPALHFAARFAAKEAFVKALGTGFREGIEWRDIEITNDPSGKPGLRLKGRTGELYRRLRARSWLSLSHEREFAVAFIILEKESGEETP